MKGLPNSGSPGGAPGGRPGSRVGYDGTGGCGPCAVAGPLRVKARTAMILRAKIFVFMADLLLKY
jgi:hypothetical protein